MVLENFLDAHHENNIDISVVTNAAHYLRGKRDREELAVGAGVDRLRRRGAGGAQGHALFASPPSCRAAGRPSSRRPSGRSAARAQGHLHPFQPQGALSRRRRGAAVLGAGAGPRRAGDDPSAASRLRRGADAGVSSGFEHRPAVRSLPRARPADRARRSGRFPAAEDRGVARRRRHLRDHQPDGLRLRVAGRGILPRLLRADEDQAQAEPLPEDGCTSTR